MEAGETETGATVHYVNEELDGGEIIIQSKVPIYTMTILNHLRKPPRREVRNPTRNIRHVKSKLQEPNSGYMLQDDVYRWDGRLKRKDLDEQIMPTQ